MTDHSARLPTAIDRLQGFDYSDPTAIYSVTNCVQGRYPVFANPVHAQPVLDALIWLRGNRGLAVYAYCLMPDHLHLLIRPQGPLGLVIKSLKKHTTRRVQELGRPGKLWQDNYYDRILRKSEDAMVVARYILENPVRKGLAAVPEEYRWSGLLDPME
jgi:REP element-mobilizing transposase RayT